MSDNTAHYSEQIIKCNEFIIKLIIDEHFP